MHISILFCTLAGLTPVQSVSMADVLSDNAFSPGYFWMWNAKYDHATFARQLDDMRVHGLRSVCIHPFPKTFRPQTLASEMSPDYLTDAYRTAFAEMVRHAGKLGMHAWLYDEGGWPSGGADGKLAAVDQEGRFCLRQMERTADGAVRLVTLPYARTGNYPSLIEPGATELFLELTHDGYYRAIPEAFGKTIRFAFTDEPHGPRSVRGGLPWATDFDIVFRDKKGYDIRPHVSALLDSSRTEDPEVVRVRIDYQDVLADLFRDRYLMVVQRWCHDHGISSGGHLDGENEPENTVRFNNGSILRSLKAMDVPGVDVIWRQLFPDGLNGRGGVFAPFPRYAASAQRQNGGTYVLSETFGIFGNSLSPAEMRWLVDYQLVRGVNVFVFGYYAASNAGKWMLLFEPHSGPVTPYWDFEPDFFDYVERRSSLLAQGRSGAETAVLYDVRGFWAGGEDCHRAAEAHYAVSRALDSRPCDFDFVEDVDLATAEVTAKGLRVGAMTYRTIVLPTDKWLCAGAREKLSAFAAAGGRVVRGGDVSSVPPTCAVAGEGLKDIRVMKRILLDRTVYFVVNESRLPRTVDLMFAESGPVTRFDRADEKLEEVASSGGRFAWTFAGCDSEIFVVGRSADRQSRRTAGTRRLPDVGWTLRRLDRITAGARDFERQRIDETPVSASLGDWRNIVGPTFAGRAVYRRNFDAGKGGAVVLDLGDVRWVVGVRLNGQDLGRRFLPPFKWTVRLRPGENVLEVEVANLLSALTGDKETRQRMARDYPPSPYYEKFQGPADTLNREGGLYGPVTMISLE